MTLADGRELLNLCANNYLGLANHPAVLAAAREALGERGYGMASVRFICGTQDIHRELERAHQRVPRLRGHDPLRLLLRRQRRPLRDAARRAGRDHLGRAQPRLDHRRRAALQGAAACATRTATPDELEAAPARGLRRAPPPDRDRRRVLDGRPHRAAAAHLRARRAVRRDGHGRRLARRRLHGPGRPRHAGAARRRRARRPGHGHARQGARRRERRLHERAARGDRGAAAALAPVPLLQQPRPADRRREPRRASTCSRTRARRCASGCSRHTHRFRRELDGARPRRRARRAPDRAGHVRRRPPRAAAAAERLLEHGVYAVAFSYPVVPMGQARIRTQLSAALSDDDVDRAIAAFAEVARRALPSLAGGTRQRRSRTRVG